MDSGVALESAGAPRGHELILVDPDAMNQGIWQSD